jgi:hypothetical protein
MAYFFLRGHTKQTAGSSKAGVEAGVNAESTPGKVAPMITSKIPIPIIAQMIRLILFVISISPYNFPFL